MKNKSAKNIVRSYKIKCAIVAFAYVVAFTACIVLMSKNVLVAIAAIVVLAASVKAPFDKLMETDIESVMYDELDPEKYNEILSLGVIKKSVHHKILGAMAVGDHQRILDLAAESDKTTMHPVEKCNNLYRRGFVYFERGEFDKLPRVVYEFEKLKRDNPKMAHIFANFTVFDKFDAFADEDYEYVVGVCDIDLKENSDKKQNHKLTRINVSFYRAVSLYKMSKFDEAIAGFEDIIAYAPKMYKAKLSREYIDMIKKEKQLSE